MTRRIRMIFPAPLNAHTRALIESQVPAALVRRPDFEVEFVGSSGLMRCARVSPSR